MAHRRSASSAAYDPHRPRDPVRGAGPSGDPERRSGRDQSFRPRTAGPRRSRAPGSLTAGLSIPVAVRTADHSSARQGTVRSRHAHGKLHGSERGITPHALRLLSLRCRTWRSKAKQSAAGRGNPDALTRSPLFGNARRCSLHTCAPEVQPRHGPSLSVAARWPRRPQVEQILAHQVGRSTARFHGRAEPKRGIAGGSGSIPVFCRHAGSCRCACPPERRHQRRASGRPDTLARPEPGRAGPSAWSAPYSAQPSAWGWCYFP